MVTCSWYNSQWQTPWAKFAKPHLRRSKVLRPKVRLTPDISASLPSRSSLLKSRCIHSAKQHLCCRTDSRSCLNNRRLCKEIKLALAKCSIQSRTRAPTLRCNKTHGPLKRISQNTCQSSCAPYRRANGPKSSKWAGWARAMKSVCKAPHSSPSAQREACSTEFSCVNLIQTQARKFLQMLDPSKEIIILDN